MMASRLLNRSKDDSLTTQIRASERQVLNRQRRIDSCTDALVRNIGQQMTAPSTLLLVCGVGFIIGELTQRQPAKSSGTADNTGAAETSPLRIAFNLISSIQTLYSALPMVWMLKTFFQPDTSGQPPNPHYQAAPFASGSTENSQQP